MENILIEGNIKVRDGKKWKARWAVLSKLSPVADSLQLQLYRDSRDRARKAPPRSSLQLMSVLALQTGFTVDKESHTLAILSTDTGSLVLAVESRDRLLQWQTKLTNTLGEEHSWMVQLVQVPNNKTAISTGPARLHIRDHRLTLTANCPPKLLATWHTADLRRYGVLGERFVWEGGTRAAPHQGVYAVMYNMPRLLAQTLDYAVKGMLDKVNDMALRPMSRNASISWMKDGSTHHLHGNGDCMSLAGLDSTFSSQGSLLRRTSGNTTDIYTTRTSGSSGSSSGGSMSEDPGSWWAAAWATGRGWQGGAHQNHTDSVYDIPRNTPCSPSRIIARGDHVSRKFKQETIPSITGVNYGSLHQQDSCSIQTTTSSDSSSGKYSSAIEPSILAPSFSGTFSPGTLTNNPLDNYDVPKPTAQSYYDIPRKLFGGSPAIHGQPTASCTSVLGWAGKLVCGRAQLDDSQSGEVVSVNGEGRMPVVNASTGVLLKQPLQVQHHHVRGDLYAVVNKSGLPLDTNSMTKYKCDERIQTKIQSNVPSENVIEHNYVNVNPNNVISHNCNTDNESKCKNLNDSSKLKEPRMDSINEDRINPCSKSELNTSLPPSYSEPQSSFDQNISKSYNENHYIVMKPNSGIQMNNQSHYICMNSSSLHSFPKTNSHQYSSLPRKFSGYSDYGRNIQPEVTSITTSQLSSSALTSSSSSKTLCSSTSGYHLCNYLYDKKEDEMKPIIKKNIFIPRNGRSLSLAKNDSIYVHGRPRSNSADSRIGESESWDKDIKSPLNTPPSSPRRRRKKSGINRRTPRCRYPDSYLPGESDSGCEIQEAVLRRSSSAPGKTINRDSASSNDSGMCDSVKSCASMINHGYCSDNFISYPRSSDMFGLSCVHGSLPRMNKCHLLGANFLCENHHFHPGHCCNENKFYKDGSKVLSVGTSEGTSGESSSNGSAESRRSGLSKGRGSDGRSTASDTSDYHDTLSLASTLSTEQERLSPGGHTTLLRPRTGKDYTRLDRTLLQHGLAK